MVIVVTGGIGSGKSEVCRIIGEKYGLPLYNADAKVKEIYVRYPSVVEELERQLGCPLRDGDGVFIPKLLADRIFGDHIAVGIVEKLIFPYLSDDFDAFLKESSMPVVFESATVLEKDAFNGFGDVVVLVDAPMDVRMARACARDASDKEKVRARMDSQKFMNIVSEGCIGASEAYKAILDRIDHMIINTGTFHDLEIKVQEVMDKILSNTKQLNNNKLHK